jgi:hypothetical protein
MERTRIHSCKRDPKTGAQKIIDRERTAEEQQVVDEERASRTEPVPDPTLTDLIEVLKAKGIVTDEDLEAAKG